MAFSPPVVGCLVKKRLAKGGWGESRATPLVEIHLYQHILEHETQRYATSDLFT